MKDILLVGDIHFADRPPSSCTETYNDDLFDLMYQTVKIASSRGVECVVWVGDVFHVKAAARNSHALVQRVIQLCFDYGCPVIIVPGNHDLQNDRLDSLSKQPLGTVFLSGAAVQAGTDLVPALDMGDGSYVKFVPWQQSWERLELIVPRCGPKDLVVAHAPLYPLGQELPYEYVSSPDWARAQRFGYCYYGHVHERHGVWGPSPSFVASEGLEFGVQFCNHGAITRGSLHEHDLTREPAVTLWNHVDGFREIKLNAKPASEVFRLVEIGEEREYEARLDEFLATVSATQIDVLSIESVLASVRERTDIDDDTKKVCIELIEAVLE